MRKSFEDDVTTLPQGTNALQLFQVALYGSACAEAGSWSNSSELRVNNNDTRGRHSSRRRSRIVGFPPISLLGVTSDHLWAWAEGRKFNRSLRIVRISGICPELKVPLECAKVS